MTKYILAGGADRTNPDYGHKLLAEISKSGKKPAKVLLCLFAALREDWEAKFTEREAWFKQVFGQETSCTLAFPDDFEKQTAEAELIYLYGGDDTLLAHYLDKYTNLEELFKNKIVVGTSAGANWLAKKFWTCDWRKVMSGHGLLNWNVITHYGSGYGADDPRGPIDWQKAKAKLEAAVGSDEKIICLHEGEFVVVEQ